MKTKTCCVTGHRDITVDQQEAIREELRKEVRVAVQKGYTHFISGFAQGADLFFADVVTELQDEGCAITLEAAIPYRKRLQAKDAQFCRMLARCDTVTVVCEAYSKDCYRERNRYMIEQSERVIVVYDGRKSGGTYATMYYAARLARDVRLIHII